MAGTRASGSAKDLLDVAAFRNADALLHVVRLFRDATVPHPAGSLDPARDVRAMEDELILADLGVVERRLERLDKDLRRRRRTPISSGNRTSCSQCRTALENGHAAARDCA